MNDFTKEELTLINTALHQFLENVTPIEMKHLQDKLLSMINNYCDHKWYNCCCGCDMQNISCALCERYLENE